MQLVIDGAPPGPNELLILSKTQMKHVSVYVILKVSLLSGRAGLVDVLSKGYDEPYDVIAGVWSELGCAIELYKVSNVLTFDGEGDEV